jgi:HEAT repeat protein
MDKRIFRSLAVLCILLIGFVAYLLMSGPQKPEVTPSAEIAEKTTDAPAQSAAAAKGDQKVMPQPTSAPQTHLKAAAPVDQDQAQPDFLAEARRALSDADTTDRVTAVRQLRNEASEEAIALLQDCLDDPSTLVVTSALNSLAFIGKKEPFGDKVYEILESKAIDENFPERGQALVIAALFSGDERLLPVISDYISADGDGSAEGDNSANINSAARALVAIGTPACVDPLQQILNASKDPSVHRMAFDTLAKIESPEAVNILQQHLRYGDSADRVNSAMALAVMDKAEYNNILVETLANQEVDDQVLAAIGRSPAGPAVFEKMIYGNDIEKEVRIQYLGILQDSMLKSTNETRTGIMKTVAPLLDSGDPELEMNAIKIFGMGFGELDTVEILKPKLQSADSKVREAAVDAYRTYVTEDSYKPLLDLIWDKDENIRRQALMLAQQYIDQSDYPVLEKAKDHEDEFIREHVSSILN